MDDPYEVLGLKHGATTAQINRREPVRYKRKPPTAAGFGRLRERLQTDAPCAPDCGFSRHMSRCEPRASTRPRDPSNLETVSREGGHGLTN